MVLLLSGQIGRAVEAWEDNGKTDSPMSVPEGDSPWEISIAWQPAARAEPADSERLEAIDSLLKDELRRYREMEIRYHSGNADLNDLEDSRSRMILLAIERLLLFPAEAESRKLIAGLRQELYRVQERQLQELELAYQTGAGPLEDIWKLRARQLRLLLEADDRILYNTVAEVPERRRILLTELAETPAETMRKCPKLLSGRPYSALRSVGGSGAGVDSPIGKSGGAASRGFGRGTAALGKETGGNNQNAVGAPAGGI